MKAYAPSLSPYTPRAGFALEIFPPPGLLNLLVSFAPVDEFKG